MVFFVLTSKRNSGQIDYDDGERKRNDGGDDDGDHDHILST